MERIKKSKKIEKMMKIDQRLSKINLVSVKYANLNEISFFTHLLLLVNINEMEKSDQTFPELGA